MSDNQSTDNSAQRFISIVQQRFRQFHRKYTVTLAVIFLGILFGGLILGGILESLFYLPAGLKITLVVALLATAAGVLVYYYQKLDRLSFREFYQRFGKSMGLPELSNALDLYFDTRSNKAMLHEAAIRQNLDKLNPQDIKSRMSQFTRAHPIHKHYRSGLAGALGMLILLLAFTVVQPSAMDRLSHLWISYTPPNPYSFTVEPGSITLEQGESFTPRISFEGEQPEHLSLAFKTDIEDKFRHRNALSSESEQASFAPISLTTNGTYYLEMDGFRTRRFHVKVQLRPRLEQLSLAVIPPAYTRLDTTSYHYPFSKIRAYKGSELRLTGITNKPVKALTLNRTTSVDSLVPALQSRDSTVFNHSWTISAVDTVSFSMTDSAGLSNKNKFRFIIEPREDQPPYVDLTQPEGNIKMKTPATLQLQYEAGDDFGLTGASLHYELQRAFMEQPQKGSLSLPHPAMNEPQQYEWEIPKLDPKPRDVLTYWIQVRDNDRYNGTKVGRSQKLVITFPSMTEYMDELESKEGEVTQSLDSLSQSFDQMQQEYDQFKKQLRRNPETNYQQKKQLDKVEQQRKKIDKQVEELNKKFEQIRKELKQNQVMSPETMQAYDQLQKLMQEIDDPELRKALEKLRNSLGDMSPDQMRKALEDYEFNEEQYQQRIKRTLELFKSLKMNSDLEKMAKSLEELSRQEQKISESEQKPAQDLEQQQAVEQDLSQVQKQLEKLSKNAPDKAQNQVKKLQQDAGQQIDQTKKQLQKNMKQLQQQKNSNSNQTPSSRQQQRQIQKQLQQTAQQMRSAKQQMNQQRMQVNMAALEYVLYSMINLSTNQEELTKETENLPPRSKAFVQKAQKERNISSQFSMLSDSLFSISSQIPGFSNSLNRKKAQVDQQLSRAVNMLAERDQSNSTFAQRQALGGINELATMVASLLDQLQHQQGGGAGSGMSMQQLTEQLKKMSGQQQQLNKQIQQMINDIQGNRLSKDQMERLNQMARQQNRIRKQLRELQRKGELESGDRVLSELQRMSEQMEDAINELRGGQLNRDLMQRQQNILSRMLSARKAVQERGKEDRRQATTAQEQPDTVPPNVTLEQLQQRIRNMLNDPNRTKFTEDYQHLIEQYFELLKKQKKDVIQ